MSTDLELMSRALAQARIAREQGDVPVGAVVVDADGGVLSEAPNARESAEDPTAHAEVLALREAAQTTGSWRLDGCTIYVTKEPCPMCAGAIYQARIARLVYGAPDDKGGAAGSLMNIPQDPRLNHFVEITSGVLEQDCRRLLQDFFRQRR